MLKSVIYMHRFQLNDARDLSLSVSLSARAAPKAHAHAPCSVLHDNDVCKWNRGATGIRVHSKLEPKSQLGA